MGVVMLEEPLARGHRPLAPSMAGVALRRVGALTPLGTCPSPMLLGVPTRRLQPHVTAALTTGAACVHLSMAPIVIPCWHGGMCI